jgi:hypothetical protein
MWEKNRARLYRARAEELRQLAVHFRNPSAQAELLRLADNWQAMAERIESRPSVFDMLPSFNEFRRKSGV